MPTMAQIKRTAKDCLRRYWGPAIGVFFIFAAVYILRAACEEVTRLIARIPLSMNLDFGGFIKNLPMSLRFLNLPSVAVTALFVIFGVLLLSPVLLGAKRYFWRLSSDEPSDIGRVFDYFTSSRLYFRSIALTVQIAFRALCYAVAMGFPVAVLLFLQTALAEGRFGFAEIPFAAYLCGAAAGWITALIPLLLIFLMQRYFLAGYFAAADDDLEISDAISYSIAWMQGHNFRIIALHLSFIGWYLLCILVLPMLYVFPYAGQTFACCAREIILEHHRRKEYFRKLSEPMVPLSGDAPISQAL